MNEEGTNASDGIEVDSIKVDINVSANKGASEVGKMVAQLESLDEKLKEVIPRLNDFQKSANKPLSGGGSRRRKSTESAISEEGVASSEGTRPPSARKPIQNLGSWSRDFRYAAESADLISETLKANGDILRKYEHDLDGVVRRYEVINGLVTKIYDKTKSQAKLDKEAADDIEYDAPPRPLQISDWQENLAKNRQTVSGDETKSGEFFKTTKEERERRRYEDWEFARKFNTPISEDSQKKAFGTWFGDFSEAAKSAKMVAETSKSNGDIITKYEENLGNIVNMYEVINGIVTKIYSKTKSQAELERERKKEGLGVFGEGKYEGLATSAKKMSEKTTASGTFQTFQTTQKNLFGPDTVTTYKVVNGIIQEISENTGKAARSTRRMDSLLTSAKHVIKYRAISTAINLVNKGLSEGVQNAALFNSQVNESISDVVSSTIQLTNQIGAAAGELIVAFSPAIVGLIDIVTIATDKLTQLFAALNGKTEYDKAVAQAYDFAKSIRSAYSGIGIDELNLFGQGGAGGTLPSMKYEKAELDEWAKALSEVRIGGETVLGFISENIGLIAGSIVTIKGVSAGITFAKPFMDFLNPKLDTGGVVGSKNLLDNVREISLIAGAISLGIGGDMLMNGKPEDDLLGMIVTYIGTALGIKGVTGMALGTSLQVSIPVTFLLAGGFKLTKWFMESPGVSSGNLSDKMEDVVDTMELPAKTHIWDEWDSLWDFVTTNSVELFADLANGLLAPLDNLAESISAFFGGKTQFPEINSYKEPGSQTSGGYGAPATLPATSPSDVFDDVDYTSFAPDANVPSVDEGGQYSAILSGIYSVLRQIEAKNTSVVLSDDDVGRAYDRYRDNRGVTMNGG